MQIPRVLKAEILEKLRTSNKAIIIYGPRQVGKTTLCRELLSELGFKTLSLNADEQQYIDILSSRDSKKLFSLVAGYQLLFIDEAQRVPAIGINLKILLDGMPELKILVTGSSSFEISNFVSEPLTGRNWSYQLYPISQLELKELWNTYELSNQLEERLIWGSYPEIFRYTGNSERYEYIQKLSSDYLYKDIFTFNEIQHSEKLYNLLKLIAFQIGNEVSLSELATQLGMSRETVARYLDLLEKTFVLFHISGFSRNLRKEVTKMNKYYFYDLGVRNSIIDNFKLLSDRNDVGQLFENFLILERMKRNTYKRQNAHSYFWRTYSGTEIDYIEEKGDTLFAFEFKWNKKISQPPKTWREQYPHAPWTLITEANWLDFLL